MSSTSDLTVSLEPHLLDSLTPLIPLVPTVLHEKLSEDLTRPEISYSLLLQVSQWSRTEDGATALKSVDLDPLSYTMVSLLAGTRTSPSKSFPKYTPSESPDAIARREWSDRRAITAIVNSVLSVGCSGGAAWWAADKSGWQDEWKVLLALAVAAVVALSETILYIIWQSKATTGHRTVRGAMMDSKTTTATELSLKQSMVDPTESPHKFLGPRGVETTPLISSAQSQLHDSTNPSINIRHRKPGSTVEDEE